MRVVCVTFVLVIVVVSFFVDTHHYLSEGES